MQQETRVATFNVLNLAPPGVALYENLAVCGPDEVEAKLAWLARQFDLLDADVVAVQEVFSQALLDAVLARTRGYRTALRLGQDPAPGAARYTPNVALVTRLPLAGPVRMLDFPPELGAGPDTPGFARAPLLATLQWADGTLVDVIVVHLKSRRPDYRVGESMDDPVQFSLAHLRSLHWRALEAAALRVHVSRLLGAGRPCIVLGDFNDAIGAVTTELVLGYGAEPATRLADAAAIAHNRPSNAFTLLHEGVASTIDHILVSPQLAVSEVHYFNQHLREHEPGASDHGQVLAKLYRAPPPA
ncbi:endonuclease/exonuclease/phosphatase family protein [Massilia sp. TS11]|uniref:endonuclease/exonuclease/phosphatase family protein n=1 Tax=Massilia sp. TS11 TaxID=2908003 RepID=UPI001EDA6C98|nr:endonuclease/exonuclease/phosphatase family protein [Massilia sp. TS11]MCG2583545.1 endonuclease/exonuclease/phosphatase family protein [Massilia sp. TS11]